MNQSVYKNTDLKIVLKGTIILVARNKTIEKVSIATLKSLQAIWRVNGVNYIYFQLYKRMSGITIT